MSYRAVMLLSSARRAWAGFAIVQAPSLASWSSPSSTWLAVTSNAQGQSHNSKEASPNTFWVKTVAVLSALLIPTFGIAHADDQPDKRPGAWPNLLSLDKKRRIFFKYEKRIRENSSLEKIFDYFSSHEKDGVKYMTPLDLLAAIVPIYPPSQSLQERAGSLDGEPVPRWVAHERLAQASASVFNKFDVDGDGVLSFWEYRLVLTLLSIPETDVEVIFNVVDLDGSGTIDAQEFEEVVASLEGRAPGSKKNLRALSSRLGKGATLPSQTTPSGLLVSFFGKDQKGKLKLSQFMQFLKQLHVDMINLEFSHYDVYNKGVIPGVDYLRSLVAVADVRHVDGLMNKIDALSAEQLATPVSLNDFRNTLNVARHGHSLEVALHFCLQVGRSVSREDLNKLIQKLTGAQLSSQTLDLLMAVFSDANGHLDVPPFIDVMHRRRKLWNTRDDYPSGNAPLGLFAFWQCIKECGIGGDNTAHTP